MDGKKLTVAISGGGIASMCLAHALCKHDHFDVKVFEGSDIFREDGAAVGLGSNAQEALRLISSELGDALTEAGGTPMDPSVRLMMGTGPDAGKHIGDIRPKVPQVIVHRGPFLRALRKKIPDGILEMGKRLSDVVEKGRRVGLKFEDGTSYEADALVGCDGISSRTRKLVLGPDHPAVNPVYRGGNVHRVVVPLSTAIAAFGEEYCSQRTQHGWIGDGGLLLTDLVDNASSMQVIASKVSETPWLYDSPFVEWSKDKLVEDFKAWGELGKKVTQIFLDQEKVYAAGRRYHLETPTYHKGQVCLVGDAAQAFPPGQGAGAGIAIEDALILSTVLQQCRGVGDIVRAFEVYDMIRRPRRSNVAETSQRATMFLVGRDPEAGVNIDLLAKWVPDWASNIYDYDLKGSVKEASRLMSVK